MSAPVIARVFADGYAVIVGAGGDLQNTVTDAEGFAAILVDPGRCAYPSAQVRTLTGPAAGRDAVLSALETLAVSARSTSTAVVYFSGHGYRTEGAPARYYLMPHGYDLGRLEQTAIQGDELASRLASVKASRLLLLLDCCHAGGADQTKAPGATLGSTEIPADIESMFAAGSGRIAIASSRADEVSFAGRPYSAFTLALVEALCGLGSADRDGYVRASDLAMYASQRVPQRTRDRQHPVLRFSKADNFVVAYYAGGELAPKGLPFAGVPEIEPEPGVWPRGDLTMFTINVNAPTGFVQPEWTVGGSVTQAQRDVTINIDNRRQPGN